jgi:hypothetical protein
MSLCKIHFPEIRVKLTRTDSRYLVNAHLAAAIAVIVILQRKNGHEAAVNVKLEAAKSIMATIIWFFLLLDAAFRDSEWQRGSKTIKANASVIIVLYVWYKN